MSLFSSSAVGIDLSDGTLKAVRLQRSGRRVTWTHSWRIGCAGEDDPQAATLDALARLLREQPVGARTQLVLSLPTRGSFSRTYLVPAMESARVAELVQYEVLSEIGEPAEDLIIRYHVRRGALEHQAIAFALRAARVEAWRAELASRSIVCDALETPGFALASFVEHELPQSHDRVLLAVGEVASELVLSRASGLWMRHLPLGLQSADSAELARRLAEEIASAAAHFLPADQPFVPQEIVLTEEGACDARLTSTLRRAAGVPIVRVQSLQRIHAASRLRHDGHSAEQALAMSKAFGLALTGLGIARLSAPIVTGSSRRAALRRLPAVAASVLVACATLVGVGELSQLRAAEMNLTLPVRLQGRLLDTVAARDQAQADRDAVAAQAEALLALCRRRSAVLQVRPALDALATLQTDRADGVLHIEQLWLSGPEPEHASLMTLTLAASAELDAALAARLQETFADRFPNVSVRGPDADGRPGLSRWIVELTLP